MQKLRSKFTNLDNKAGIKIKLMIVLAFLVGSFIATPPQNVSAAVPFCSLPTFKLDVSNYPLKITYVHPDYSMKEIKNSPGVCREAESFSDHKLMVSYYVDGERLAFKMHYNSIETDGVGRGITGSRTWGGR